MKKILINFKILFLFLLTLVCESVYAQKNSHNDAIMIDKNPIYSFTGIGYKETEGKYRMNFSTLSVKGNNTNEVYFKDNEVTVKKDGVYRIYISSDINKGNENPVNYLINLNSKPAFQSTKSLLSEDNSYFFQMQLKKDDVLSFDIENDKPNGNQWNNKLIIKFADPKLMTISEGPH
ncbi:hypothetical protein [Epilithonimonas sp.]|uniref:hypothetical protein n=1 Tax=Epilithonimonas sp. TaxID=2894511 RepID=UPI00289F2D00|nr:hypothetical protein [Epilithonimonas sp.]